MTARAEELWAEHADSYDPVNGHHCLSKSALEVALKEYEDQFRKALIKACHSKITPSPTLLIEDAMRNVGISDCISAIESVATEFSPKTRV